MPFLKDQHKLITNSKRLDEMTKKRGIHHAVFNMGDDRYVGEWENNIKTGKGTSLKRNYKLYEGDWNNNFKHGFGVYALKNEKVFILYYRGNWSKGLQFGFGERHYPEGGYYVGYWKNSKRCGYGQMWYTDGGFYDGDWKNDTRHGCGMWVRPDGNRYEGNWAHDKRNGKGRFFHLDNGQMQDGIWKEDFCVYSFIIDIPYRQTAVKPTPYPIQISELKELEEVYEAQEKKMLENRSSVSCLKIASEKLGFRAIKNNYNPV